MKRIRVYVLECEDAPYVKIGVAQQPATRLKSVQNGCPFRLLLAFKSPPLLQAVAYQVENRTHKILREMHKRGEWFETDVDAAISAITEARRFVKGKRAETPQRSFHPWSPSTDDKWF